MRAPNAKREADECETLPSDLVQVRKVFIVGDAVGPAHHVAWIRFAYRIVGGGGVDPKCLDPLGDDPGAPRLAQAREVGEVLGSALEPIKCRGVKQEDIPWYQFEPRLLKGLVQILGVDIRMGRMVRNVQAGRCHKTGQGASGRW